MSGPSRTRSIEAHSQRFSSRSAWKQSACKPFTSAAAIEESHGPGCLSMTVTVFDNRETQYQTWISNNQNGYVVNVNRHNLNATLHRASHKLIFNTGQEWTQTEHLPATTSTRSAQMKQTKGPPDMSYS